jgi:hypothetical protein
MWSRLSRVKRFWQIFFGNTYKNMCNVLNQFRLSKSSGANAAGPFYPGTILQSGEIKTFEK